MRALFLLFNILITITAVGQTYSPKQQGNNFTFTLPAPAVTSAGVYTKDGVLIRILWSNVKYEAGQRTGTWNGNDDLAKKLANGTYNIRVLSSNVKYSWEGVVGNTSDSFIGSSTIHNLHTIASMAFNGTTGYQAVGYSEISPTTLKFSTLNPQAKQTVPNSGIQSDFVATDGVKVYWSASNTNIPALATSTFVYVTKCLDDSQSKLQNATLYTKIPGFSYNAVNFIDQVNSTITGLSVQTNGNLLVVTRAGLNALYVIDKNTGATLSTINTFAAPRTVKFDGDNNLWMLYTKNGIATVEKFKIVANGLTSLNIKLSDLKTPESFDVSPDNLVIAVIDIGSSQVKAFDTSKGIIKWTLGQAGGYAISPNVANDKFDFIGPFRKMATFIAFEPNGSFWVSDPGNGRTQHFSPARVFINNIAYRPTSYAANVDPGNPTRIFSDFLEYTVDYNKPLAGNNGSWRLIKNWGHGISTDVRDKYYGIKAVTFGNHTYTLQSHFGSNPQYLVLYELPASGHMRNTGIKLTINDTKYYPPSLNLIMGTTRLYPDGSLYTQSRKVIGKPSIWVKNAFTGIDGSGNPTWGPAQIIASTPPVTTADPVFQSDYLKSRAGEITKTGVVVSFSAGVPPNTSELYHLGGIKNNQWIWRTSMSTPTGYIGDFPTDGRYDIGNGVKHAGSVAMAYDNTIFWGYYGEFWKGMQTNVWNHYNDDGLMIGQFGVADPQQRFKEAVAGMAGNAFSASIVKGPDGNVHLYHNDESHHGGIHRWKITGIETIKEEVIPFILPVNAPTITPYKTLDLLAGLPRLSTLTNGQFGWKRNPAADYNTPYVSVWQAQTSKYLHNLNQSPDLYVSFTASPKAVATAATVTRDLEVTAPVTKWQIKGNITWINSWPNGDKTKFDESGEGGQFLDILDDKGKTIARLAPRVNFDAGTLGVYGNNLPVVSVTRALLTPVIATVKPLSISVADGKVTFSYAGYPEIITEVFDPSSNWRYPKTFRLYFWTGIAGNGSTRQVDLSELSLITYSAGTPVIDKVPLTITADNKTIEQGQPLPLLTATYTGFVNGETVSSLLTPASLSTTATSSSPPGSYPITASGATAKNYAIRNVQGTLTIRPVVVVFNPIPTKTYGASDFDPGATSSSGTLSYTSSNTSIAKIVSGKISILKPGVVTITATSEGVSQSQTLTINKARLTITAVSKSKVYGSANPLLTVSYSGFVKGDTSVTAKPVVSTTAVATSGAGTYAITASGAASANYTFIYVAGALTVNKAALTIIADNKTKQQGQALPALTATYSGFVNGDTYAKVVTTPASLTTTATKGSPTGRYTIIAVGGVVSANYTATYKPGVLTVTVEGRQAPNIGYTNNDITFTTGAGITALMPINNGGISGFTISPALPSGLTFDTTTGKISGMPTATSAKTRYTITAYNATGSSSTTVNITVTAPSPKTTQQTNFVPTKDSFGVAAIEVVVHQALSPNGDGLNDVLTIDGLSNYADNQLSVITPNGTLIYQTVAYGTKGNVFDGHSNNGSLQKPGTYYYILEYKEGSTSKRKTGYIIIKY